MRVGVKYFRADKLRDALDYRSITQKELADRIGVQPPQVSKYLQEQKPSPEAFQAICLALSFPREFFLTPVGSSTDVLENTNVELWRSLKSSTNRARRKGKVILKFQKELYSHLSGFFEYPRFEPPSIEIPTRFEDIDAKFIDQYCLELRESWELGSKPINNLIRILECRGVCVCRAGLDSSTQDAVSVVENSIPYILLNTSVRSSARARFNVAHELGHILLHRNISRQDLEDPDRFDEIEEQAHYFAASLLLPETQLAKDFWAPTLKCLEGLKRKWNLSIQAIMRRCLDLGLITSAQFSYLNIAISRKGWRKVEPYDEITPIEKPRLFSQSLERLESDHNILSSSVKAVLNIPTGDLAELCSVSPNRFTESKRSGDIIDFDNRI